MAIRCLPAPRKSWDWKWAGTIADWGSRVLGWQKGNRVRALLTGGGYAEQVVLPARMLIAMPDDKDFIWGAALPEAVLTAYLNLFMEAGLQDGETVLIHGGASGVGTYGIQMARLAGCRVLVTAGSEAKLAACRELGAELAVNYKEEDFVERIRSPPGRRGGGCRHGHGGRPPTWNGT